MKDNFLNATIVFHNLSSEMDFRPHYTPFCGHWYDRLAYRIR